MTSSYVANNLIHV